MNDLKIMKKWLKNEFDKYLPNNVKRIIFLDFIQSIFTLHNYFVLDFSQHVQ